MNNIGWVIVVFIIWFVRHEELIRILLGKLEIKEDIKEYANRNILK